MKSFARNRPTTRGVNSKQVVAISVPRLPKRQIRMMAEGGEQPVAQAAEPVVAEQPAEETKSLISSQPTPTIDSSFIPVLREEDLQKGQRKEIEVDDQQVVLFWYRNELFAVQSRSPAEGAYSQGFVAGTFTQDYGIRCPSTGSIFSLKTGECLSWFPENAFLRTINPAGDRKIEIYPTQITDGVIYVNTQGSSQQVYTKGGADTSLTGDDVYYTEGDVQEELPGRDAQGNRVMDASSWAILIATSVAISSIALVGGIVGSYLQDDSIIVGGLGITALAIGFFYWQFFKKLDGLVVSKE